MRISKRPILLLLSGGSALELLDKVDRNNLNSNITISVLDERYSKDPAENNFAQITKTEFYKRAKEKGCRFIDTRVSNRESQEGLAERFNGALIDWFEANSNGALIATVGIGPDGHTSGMMPFPEDPEKFKDLFEIPNKFVTAYDATGKNPYPVRVTTNITLMRKINTAIIYAVGENKRDALNRLKTRTGSLAEAPSRVLMEIKNSFLFTDLKI